MTTTGTTTEKAPEKRNMIDVLKMIKNSVNNKAGVPLSEYPVGQMLRLFNEGTKNIDGETYQKMKDDIGQQGKDSLDMFGQDSLSVKFPVEEEYIRNMFSSIANLDDDLKFEDGWDEFWQQEKKELQAIKTKEGKDINDPAIDKEIDNEIQTMQNRVLSAYRFKVIQKVYLDNLNKPGSKNLSTFNKFQQTLNGIILRSPPGSDLYVELEKSQKEVFGPYFSYDINNIIAKANEMRKNNVSEEEIAAMIEKERNLIFENIAGAKGGETYSIYFGEDKARAIFDELFSVENINKKSKSYASNSQQLGFDIDSELKSHIYITGAPGLIPDVLSHDEKRVIEDYCESLKGAGYFPISTNNDALFQQKTIEELLAKKAAVQKIYDAKKPALQSFFAQKLNSLAKDGNAVEITLCKKIQESFGGLEPLQKDELSSHLNKRLFEAIDNEDKKSLEAVLPHVDLEQKNQTGHTPLQKAALEGKKDIVESLLKKGAKDTETTQYKRGFFTRMKDAFKGLTEGGLKGLWSGLTKKPPRTASSLAKMMGHDDIQGLIRQGNTPPTVPTVVPLTLEPPQPLSGDKPTPPPREPEPRVRTTLSPQPIPQPPLGSGITRETREGPPPRPSRTGEMEPQTLTAKPKGPPPPTPDQPLSKHLESAISSYDKSLTPEDTLKLNRIVGALKSLEAKGDKAGITNLVQVIARDTKVSPELKEIVQRALLNKPLEKLETVGNVSTGISERIQRFTQNNVQPLNPRPSEELAPKLEDKDKKKQRPGL